VSAPKRKLEVAVFVRVEKAADRLLQRLAASLKPSGLTPAQYNVLRILRGAGPAGLPCGEIGARLINHDPDVTRLLDRLEKRGLTGRLRGAEDRRVVVAHILPAGLSLLDELDPVIDEFHRSTLGHLTVEDLRELARLLGRVAES
jgi:DNA-binding MarR family transcriptional regulator